MIGPDAGFSAAEIAMADAAGVVGARLGDGVLRAETAAIVAAAIGADVLGWGDA